MSAGTAATAPTRAGVVRSARAEWIVVGALVVAAVVAWALVPTYPNYDSYYHLVWGRELLDGVKPTSTPTRRRPSTRCSSLLCAVRRARRGRTPTALLVLDLLALARRARVGDLPAGRGGLRPLAGRARRAVRRVELRVPALRRARIRRRPVPGARAVGGGARGRSPRRGARRDGPARGRRACCAPRRGCSRGRTGCGASGRRPTGLPRTASVRRAGDGGWSRASPDLLALASSRR